MTREKPPGILIRGDFGKKIEAPSVQTQLLVDVQAEQTGGEQLRRERIRREGPIAAAWLIWKHRKQLHAHGLMRLQIPTGDKLPRWFAYASEFLAGHRQSRWAVSETETPEFRRFEIRWKGWHTHGRHRAEATRKARNRRKYLRLVR